MAYLFDPHVHTEETSLCGNVPAREMVHLYKRAGFHGIVITDHFTTFSFFFYQGRNWVEKVDTFLKGYRIALQEGEKVGLKVLLGAEFKFSSTGPNDFLIYGLDESFLKDNPYSFKKDLSAFRDLAEEKNILIYQAHPFRFGQSPANPSLIDGMEVYNGNVRHNSNNHLAEAFARKHGLKEISCSDAHELEDIGMGGILLPSIPENSEDFVHVLRTSEKIELFKKYD
jgi:predicted metal-dependent phosphoesterase TrpH